MPAEGATEAETAAAADPAVAGGPPVDPRSIADANKNRLSDGLEAKIEARGAQARFEVVVTFAGAGNAESSRAAIGPFSLIRNLGLVRGIWGPANSRRWDVSPDEDEVGEDLYSSLRRVIEGM